MPANLKNITIHDLAAMLGLSVATVSRALNHDHNVKAKTKKRVFEMAEKVGYRMNDYARNLRNGRSNIIGCIIPRLNIGQMSTIVAGIERSCRREDYHLVIMQSHGSVETEAHCADLLFNKRVDGLLVATCDGPDNLRHFQPFIQRKIPVIQLDGMENGSGLINISVDNRAASYELTRHLLARGRRRIVHITTKASVRTYSDVCDGYKQAMAEAGIVVRDGHIIKCDLTRDQGMRAVETMWQWPQKPDAIFAASDPCAVGCLLALRNHGIHIPGDVAVAGFGNDPISMATLPDLTTVAYPGWQMGETAVSQLMYVLQGGLREPTIDGVLLRSRLIVRDST